MVLISTRIFLHSCYYLLLFQLILLQHNSNCVEECGCAGVAGNHVKITSLLVQAATIAVPASTSSPSSSSLSSMILATGNTRVMEEQVVMQQGGKNDATSKDFTAAARSKGDIIYANSIQIVDSNSKQSQVIDIVLTEKDDPVLAASMIYKKYSLDFITYRWLLRSFQHGLQRLKEPQVKSLRLQNGNDMLPPVIVRFGDDLANLARTYSYQMGLTLAAANEIYQELIKLVPQHTSIEWVNERRKHSSTTTSNNMITKLNSPAASPKNGVKNRNVYQNQNCELTVAIATTLTENISMFKNFVEKFPTTNLVCHVIVVVDGGSLSHVKLQMMTEYPQFTFVFKSKQEEGLANTLNTIVQLCKTRYLLYASDAWKPLANDDSHLHDAIAILKSNPGRKMAQVILNNQSTISCSLGSDMSTCTDVGGWKRILKQQDGNHFKTIEYIENEFGSMYLEHAESSQWPGFSLLPAIWDLDTLSAHVDMYFEDKHSNPAAFDVMFSSSVLDAGLVTAHLPSVNYMYLLGQ